jgi:hypothetical protein
VTRWRGRRNERGRRTNKTAVVRGCRRFTRFLVGLISAWLYVTGWTYDYHYFDRFGIPLFVAMASTLAGNFTLIGSVANLIVAQRARASGVTVDFWTYFKVGAPLTVLTILFGAWWL